MVSCETPVDDEQGHHLINIGHDILLNNVFQRVFDDHLEGAHNFMVRDDGRLIAHPFYVEEFRRSLGVLAIDELPDKAPLHQFNKINEVMELNGNDAAIVYEEQSDSFLAFKHIEGPGWLFVTVYPKSLLASPARDTAVFIFILGLISLIVELIALYLVLCKKVLKPMKQFERASKLVQEGSYDLQPILNETKEQRQDEVGRLAGVMIAMSDRIYGHNAELEQKIRERTKQLKEAKQLAEFQAKTDPLTGLANRRAFFEVGAFAFENAKRNNDSLALIMLDLDKFKEINDTYGHAMGDSILKGMTVCLLEELRPSDLCARLGGEEFAVLLPSTSLVGAVHVAEKIRLSLKAMDFFSGDTVLNITSSFGVAEMTSAHFQLEAVLRTADLAMYQAKEMGRDNVVSAST